MTLATCPQAGPMPAMSVSLSALEKYLLRRGFTLSDGFDAGSRRVVTRAIDPEGRPALNYVHPGYDYHGLDRAAELSRAMAAAGLALGLDPAAMTAAVAAGLSTLPEGFACRQCGRCCACVRDAFQGRVSREEVDWWRQLGRTDVLRLIARQERPDYVLYAAWVNPKTGEHFKRCPWLVSDGGHKRCRIHEVRPLKCRSFPLSREHAERLHCKAYEDAEAGSSLTVDQVGYDPHRPGAGQ